MDDAKRLSDSSIHVSYLLNASFATRLVQILHMDQVPSEKCSDTEPKRLWSGLVQDQNWFNTIGVNDDDDDSNNGGNVIDEDDILI